MKFYNILIIFACMHITQTVEKPPIFLLHGFMGWGKDELGEFNYWGGHNDIETSLIKEGYNVFTLSVGPVSSNWDRACEAYYQIIGGSVDYGYAHSKKYNLIQKPKNKDFDGLYPEWNENNPIHIIAHSQGGQTARMLEYLLKEQLTNEESNLLNNNHIGWIKSITTISTPHNGTTLSPIVTNIFPFIQSFIIGIGMISKINIIEESYNFDLDQWGFEKQKNENLIKYINRMKQSPISKSKNFSSWDLSIEGSNEFNEIYATDSLTYYFSYSTTNKKNRQGIQMRNKILSYMISNLGDYNDDWRENDGLVNTISMKGPDGSRREKFEIPKTGVWQHMGKIYYDHHEVIGHGLNLSEFNELQVIYSKQCSLIYELE